MSNIPKSSSIPVRKPTSPRQVHQRPPNQKKLQLDISEPTFNSPPKPIPITKNLQNHDLQFEDLFVSESPEKRPKRSTPTPIHEPEGSSVDADPSSPELTDDDPSSNLDIGEGEVLELSTSKVSWDDFQILKVIGKGAYGKVFQAVKKDSHQVYALKVLRKDFLIKTKNVTYTRTERDILRTVHHPFIVSLHFAFQNEGRVCLVMDYINGGQMFYHMREQAMFSEEHSRFYAAEMVLALGHLHSIGIIHRDLKPENILLDSSGHITLTDFGLAKEFTEGEKANTFCGTAEYMSPEMIQGHGYGTSTDWWSLGILIYDMLVGKTPFKGANEAQLLQKIVKEKIKFPNYLTGEAVSIMKGLLNREPDKRLGSGLNGLRDIKSHKFFKSMNWKKLVSREVETPFRPPISKGALDVGNIDAEFLDQSIALSPVPPLTQSQERLFEGFSYVRSPTGFEEHTEDQV